MADFRSDLYERYVSGFKHDASRPDDRAFESYSAWCRYKYLPILEGLAPGDPVLELGCGPGNMLQFLQREGFTNASGIDISSEQVEIAVERGLRAEVADVFETLNSCEGRFAAILAIDFVEHFSKDELMRLVPAVYRALRPGGRLIVQTANGAGLFPHAIIYGDLTHLTVFTPESLQQILELVGFEAFQFLETGPTPRKLVGRLRVFLWAAIRAIANAVRRIETGKTQQVWTENVISCCRKSA